MASRKIPWFSSSSLRFGPVQALRSPDSTFGAVVFRNNIDEPIINSNLESGSGYLPLLQEIVKFVRTGVPPVPNHETLEIYAFMDAAQQSRDRGGIPVNIAK